MAPPEQEVESVRGVVLAGGDSTRFEAGDKALASIDSEPFLTRIVDVLAQTTHREPVIAVRTDEQQATYANTVDQTDVQFVFDAVDHDGPLAGLLGAAALDSRWLFCCGCDMPLLEPTAVTWLINQLPDQQTTRRQVDAIAIEHPTGVIEPLHTVYRRESVLELHHTLPQAAGPQMLLSELDSVDTVSIADVPEHIPIETSTTNVNTLEELEMMK